MEKEEEDLIEITEEADLIREKQIIDDSVGRRVGRHGRRKEKGVRELRELMLDLNLDEQSTAVWEVE